MITFLFNKSGNVWEQKSLIPKAMRNTEFVHMPITRQELCLPCAKQHSAIV